ncbi:unnamed protein product [Parajaminaea phylloscopi]
MPLEQIRPLLSLETHRPDRLSQNRLEQDGIASDTRRRSSHGSPRTPTDGEGLSAAASSSSASQIGPSSPSVRSNKSLLSSPFDFPRQLTESPDIHLSSASSLHKLGSGSSGVTRSGSWRAGGISVIGRGQSICSWDTDDRSEDASFSTAMQEVSSSPSQDELGLRTTASPPPRGSASDSQHFRPPRIESLGSFSTPKRASLGNDVFSPTRANESIGTPDGDPTPSASSSSGSQSCASSTIIQGASPYEGVDGATAGSSFSGPGIGRVKSIGRGSDGGEQSDGGSSLRRPSRSVLLPSVETQDESSASQTDPILALEDGADRIALSHSRVHGAMESDSPVTAGPSSPLADRRTSLVQSVSPKRSPRRQQHLTPPHDSLSPKSAATPRTGLAIDTAMRSGSPGSSRLSPLTALQSDLWDRSRSDAAGKEASSSSASSSFAVQTSSIHAARRHTAGYLRTRSALSSQTGNLLTAAAFAAKGPMTASTSFHGAGHQGGRKAARVRARHPSLALMDNAPFSVLEARRSEGLRQAAASAASDTGIYEDTEKDAGHGQSTSVRDQSRGPDRPLSPIARASPDAPRPLISLGAALTGASASSPSNQAVTGTPSTGLPQTSVQSRASPSLIAAAATASAAVEDLAAQSPAPVLAARPRLSRQHSRTKVGTADFTPLTLTPARAKGDGREGDSILRSPASSISSLDSTPAPRPALPRSSTLSSLSGVSLDQRDAGAEAPVVVPAVQTLGLPPTVVTHVLRTPTTEEWARFLVSQGVDPGQQLPRTRSTTGRSLAGAAAQHRNAAASISANAAGDRLLHAHEAQDVTATRDSLRGLSFANRSTPSVVRADLEQDYGAVAGDSDFEDGLDEDMDHRQALWGRGSVRSRSSSASSHSSQGRMEALHAAISMPPSRRGSPPSSVCGDASPQSPSDFVTRFGQAGSSLLDGDFHEGPRAVPPDVPVEYLDQDLHGYVPAPAGHKRCIDDFHIVRDIGRGAYGLVKLVQLKGRDDQQPGGPEFVVKYIIKSRILADCWRRHRILGPIPVEIHVMDQLRRFRYDAPTDEPPWSPSKLWPRTPHRRQSSGATASSPSSVRTPMLERRPSLSLDGLDRADPRARKARLGVAHTHPALCTMLDFFEDESFYYLVMPRFGHGTDLFDYIESHPCGLETNEARCILGQVADGISFLHGHNIVHRDIKDENVILDGHGHAQLIDFGSAAHVRPGRSFDTFSGTLDYAAAEILRGDQYAGKEQDVWALGVVAYVCLVGDAPFWNGEEAMHGLDPDSRAMSALDARCLPTPLASAMDAAEEEDDDEDDDDEAAAAVDPDERRELLMEQRKSDVAGQSDGGGKLQDAKDLIERCLELDPADRPSAADVCHHVFLAGRRASSWRGHRGWEKCVGVGGVGGVVADSKVASHDSAS